MKFFQIAASDGMLFALDSEGQIWVTGLFTKPGWIRMEMPTETTQETLLTEKVSEQTFKSGNSDICSNLVLGIL